ncbi:MAG: DUF433 domain-containing protein [Ignavibacteriales bacterium]|nr:DUF433 domain-containing protein [Ignavibacteriales bacterium]
MENYLEYISINPNIRFGKPCIKETRIAVVDILQWLASGMSFEEIMEDFPGIQREHILAALTFAAQRESVTKLVAA